MKDQYKAPMSSEEASKILDDKWRRNEMECDGFIFDEDEITQLNNEIHVLEAKLKIKNDKIKDMRIELDWMESKVSVAVNMVKEVKDLRKQNDELLYKFRINKNVIEVKDYKTSDKRYENIMSHMDILWHEGEHGPDGCGKCESYRNILMSAFDKIESMSSRNISQDFSTNHVKYGKTVDNNNNHIHRDMLTGEIKGGDKDLSKFKDNCNT